MADGSVDDISTCTVPFNLYGTEADSCIEKERERRGIKHTVLLRGRDEVTLREDHTGTP